MMYEDFVSDFAKRTKANLEYVQENVDSGKVYEVTQLINSLLGLLIFPQQKYYDKLPHIFPDYEIQILMEKCTSTNYKENKPKSFKNILRHLRNSIAHKRIGVEPYGPVEIERIKFEDIDEYNNSSFIFEITVEELNVLLYNLCDFMICLGNK